MAITSLDPTAPHGQTNLVVLLPNGDTYQLVYLTQPGGQTLTSSGDPLTLSWTTSNSSIVTVDSSGIITSVGVGTATVTCTDIHDSSLTTSWSIKVKDIKPDNGLTKLINGAFTINDEKYANTLSFTSSNSLKLAARETSVNIWEVYTPGASSQGISNYTLTATTTQGGSSSVEYTVYDFSYYNVDTDPISSPSYRSNISVSFSDTERYTPPASYTEFGSWRGNLPVVYTNTTLTLTVNIPEGETDSSLVWSLPSNGTNIIWSRSSNVVTLTMTSSAAAAPINRTLIVRNSDGSFINFIPVRIVTSYHKINAISSITVPADNSITTVPIGLHNQVELYSYGYKTGQALTYTQLSGWLDTSFSSSDTSIATVTRSAYGKAYLRGLSTGTVTITATALDTAIGTYTTTREFTITNVDVSGVSVASAGNATSIDVGSTLQLTATVSPSNASNKTVSWSSSNISVATVSESGLVTGVSAGSATITVTTADGSYTATINLTITVPTVTVTSMTDISGTTTVAVGSTTTLSSTVSPADATDKTITWTTDASGIVTVDASGVVTGVSAGTATITATSSNASVYKTASVTVTQPVTSMSDITGTTTVAVGSTTTLSTSVSPANATDKTITWSTSAPSVATVDASGVVTGVSTGSATITATSSNPSVSATASVTVTQPVTSMTDISGTTTVAVGSTTTLSATVSPVNATDKTITWSTSAPSVATVDASGVVTGVSAGSATITATSSNPSVSATASVTVTQPVTSMTDISGSSTVALSSTITLATTVSPADATDKTITWSSSAPSVATVDASGVVTGVGGGSATITATSSNPSVFKTKDITVQVAVIDISAVRFEYGLTRLENIGDTLLALSEVVPSNATNTSITWSSSNTAVISINSSTGNMTAIGYGSASITATSVDGGYSRSATFYVGVPVESISVITGSSSVAIGSTITLSASVTPVNAANKAITWSSDASGVASVDASGVVTGVSAGSATITAKSAENASHVSTYEITVVPVTPVTSLTESPLLSMTEGEGATVGTTTYNGQTYLVLPAQNYPNGANVNTLSLGVEAQPSDATNKVLAYTISNPSVLSIDASGVMSSKVDFSLPSGTYSYVTVTVSSESDPSISAVYHFAVVNPDITTVNIRASNSGSFLTLQDGSANLLSLWTTASNEQYTNAPITWVSLNPSIATITSSTDSPTVTAVSAGDVWIHAYYDGYAARILVRVRDVSSYTSVSSVSGPFSSDGSTSLVTTTYTGDETYPYQSVVNTLGSINLYTFTPSDATDRIVNVTLSRSDIISIDSSGVIQPVNTPGTTINTTNWTYVTATVPTLNSSLTYNHQIRLNADGYSYGLYVVDTNERSTYETSETPVLNFLSNPGEGSIGGEDPWAIGEGGSYFESLGYTSADIQWYSSDETIATVTKAVNGPLEAAPGTLHFLKAGTVWIRCIVGNFYADREFTVTASTVAVTGINDISGSGSTIVVNNTMQLSTSVIPANATNQGITWSSSNQSIATVDASGLVTGLTTGDVTITATSNDGNRQKTYNLSIVANSTPVSEISAISATSNLTYVAPGSTLALSATISPENAGNKTINWSSSNNSLATVDASGVVTGVALGNVTITATSAGNNAYFSIYALRIGVPVTGLNDISGAVSAVKGLTSQLATSVIPANASVKGITWSSSNTAVATVNASTGLVTAVEGGTATITATSTEGSYSKTYNFTTIVLPQEVANISDPSGNVDYIRVPINGTKQFSGVFFPANTTNKALTWQSFHPAIATVDASGLVTGVAKGLAGIVGTSVQNTALRRTATVEVYIPVTGISPITHSNPTDEVLIGATIDVSCNGVIPSNADIKGYNWTTSHPAHVLISRTNKLLVLGSMPDNSFTVTVTSEDGGFTETKTFTIYRPITGTNPITAPGKTIEVALNNTVQLTLPILPANATVKTVTWTSSNPNKVSIDASGVCTGMGLTVKKEVITITGSITEPTTGTTYTRTYGLTVPINKITGLNAITVAGNPGVLLTGSSYQFTTAIVPANASYASLGYTWSLSNNSVANITSGGLLTITGAVKSLKVTATAVGEGAKKKVSRSFNVVTLPTSIKSPVATTTGGYLVARGKKITLKPEVLPITATNKKVTYTSSDTNKATVGTTGTVTAGSTVGGVKITITCAGDPTISREVDITVY